MKSRPGMRFFSELLMLLACVFLIAGPVLAISTSREYMWLIGTPKWVVVAIELYAGVLLALVCAIGGSVLQLLLQAADERDALKLSSSSDV